MTVLSSFSQNRQGLASDRVFKTGFPPIQKHHLSDFEVNSELQHWQDVFEANEEQRFVHHF